MEEMTNSTAKANPSYAYRVTNRVLKHINRYYFRTSFINFDEPLEPTPTGAPRIYASNHSGMAFPWDGISFATGMLERSGYRVEESIRPLATPLLSKTPLMSPFLVPDFWERLGAIPATMKDFEASMQQEGTNLLIYPEGIDGIGKGFDKRYQLQHIATSLIRMSIKFLHNLSHHHFTLNSSRKLPRQVDHSKVEDLALFNASAGVIPPRLSWSRSSLYSSIHAHVISRTSSRSRNSQVSSTSVRYERLNRSM